MHTRTTWLYALSLLLPTLLVAGVLLRLLAHERERLVHAGALAAGEQARGVAGQIVVAVEGFKAGVERQLAALPAEDLPAALKAWARRDPLVRSVFIIHDTRGVLLPDQSAGLTGEEQAFLQRFGPLINGQSSWQVSAAADTQPTQTASSSGQRLLMVQNLFALTQNQKSAPAVAETQTTWLPWFAGRNLHLLASIRRTDGLRYGVEIEMTSLLAAMITAFPERMPAGQSLALLDGQGAIMHNAGAIEFTPGLPRLATVELAPNLPHWQIAVAGTPAADTGRALLFTLAAILVGILILAILGGGGLLWHEARRSAADARTKTTFVANVSHELKTPLTTIRMYAELLSEGRARDETRRAHYLDVIVQESQRLTRLINNVLDFSRLEQGRKTYRPERLDLADEVRRIAEAHSERLLAAGLAVDISNANTPCPALADRDAFEQALLNVLDNATKYAAEGRRLAIQIGCEDGQAVVRVCDWGRGVPASHRSRLFQQFHRVDNTLTARQPGCGLGLSISRRLLRDQGGDLRYETAPEGGACFVLSLPRATEDAHESA
jgi:signal transduction histidine kinase